MKKSKNKKITSIVSTLCIFLSSVFFAPNIQAGAIDDTPVFTLNILSAGVATSYESINERASSTIQISAEVLKNGNNTGTNITKWELDIVRVNSDGQEIALQNDFQKTEIINQENNPLTHQRVIHTTDAQLIQMGNPDSLYFKFSLRAYLAPYTFPPGPAGIATGNGDTAAGFYGFVPASEFITGDALATKIGLTAGTSHNSDAGWLKFSSNGKTLYVAMKTFRYSISFDNINAVSGVYGNRTVMIDGNLYKIRLLTGATTDPGSTSGREWKSLMYGVHTSTNPQWGPGYSNTDLGIGSGNGAASFIQERSTASTQSNYRLARGEGGITSIRYMYSSNAGYIFPSTINSVLGWRPVLELVP
jgi:hypothetical protein